MSHLLEYNQDWLEHNGKVVTLSGLKYKINVSTFQAIYPYEHTAINVCLEPVSKASKHYKEVKQQLGDDWSTDLLDSDVELQCEVLAQV